MNPRRTVSKLPRIRSWSTGIADLGKIVSLAVMVSVAATPATAKGLIRDSEIESLLRLYANPLFKAAGLKPSAVEVNIIGAQTINAFVSGGQRMFIHTGLITQSETPNQVIGVLAHETGHIAGGHLSRLRRELEKAQTSSIISLLVGAAAIAGSAAAGARNVGAAGQGVVLGGQNVAQRTLLSYQRAQEAAADQAAMTYLNATKQSGKGMMDLFDKLANQSVVSLQYVDPYVLSHPVPRTRVRYLETEARKSRYFNKKDSPALIFRHKMAQAKLHGFLDPASSVFRRYPTTNKSIDARYARAIASYRKADMKQAIRSIDGLIKEMPKNPYFWELKGQVYYESGRAKEALKPLRKAVSLAPNAALIRILLAQALIAVDTPKTDAAAIKQLRKASTREFRSITLHQQLAIAHARQGDLGRADLASAEAAFLAGDLDLAKQRAKRAKARLKAGTPQWVKANDIISFKKPRKG